MPAARTIVKCHKLRIKSKFKCLEEETDNIIAKLQSCVSCFRFRLTELLNEIDENFFSAHKILVNDFEKYQEKLCYLLVSLDNPSDFVESDNSCELVDFQENKASADISNVLIDFAVDQNSSQTKPKTVQSHTSLVSSSSFCSLQDSNISNAIQNSISNEHYEDSLPRDCVESASDYENPSPSKIKNSVSTEQHHVLGCMSKSNESTSQSSCYRSLSSNASAIKLSTSSNLDEQFVLEDSVNKASEKININNDSFPVQFQSNLPIPPPVLSVNAVISASLSHIVNPEDFWMQLKNSRSELNYCISQFIENIPPDYIQPGDFCLAPFKSLPYYYRAQALHQARGDEMVEVFFLDHGSTQRISVKNLRPLPSAAYEIPMQAFHCRLDNISSINGIWTKEAIEKFKEFQNNPIQTYVKSLNCGKYEVQLIATIAAGFGEEFSCNIADALCLDGLASINKMLDSNEGCYPNEISNQISCDSGVSVTSNQRSSPVMQLHDSSSDVLSVSNAIEPFIEFLEKPILETASLESKYNQYSNINIPDLISFDSLEDICKITDELIDASEAEAKDNCEIVTKKCSRTNCSCALHLIVPPPSISFVEKDMMLVMLSTVVNPSEFYVNLALEDSFTLDELREQMTTHYDTSSGMHLISLDDLTEDMFCACRYVLDGNWYRVKILKIHTKPKESCDISVQYIDYGNKVLVKHDSLRLLLPEFAKHPSFAIKCSLAGIKPKCEKPKSTSVAEDSRSWSNDAIEKFEQFMSYDRCLTAQICETRPVVSTTLFTNECTLQVLLWDTEGTKDLLINEALVESGLAEIDYDFVKRVQERNTLITASAEITIPSNWDPMNEDFTDIKNSYGVHIEDSEVAVLGYKPKDESYICHYFSMRGYCPRGDKCEYEHVEIASGGVTRDQEAVYSLDPMVPLPNPSAVVLVQVSAVLSPGIFYCILPYGNKTVDEIDCLTRKGTRSESLRSQGELRALFAALNKQYTNAPFMENTTISLAYGTIVVAWRKADKAWHRGRIIDVSDIAGSSKVFFVDFGNEEWVPRKLIREILPEFLHTPFQAVECHLSDVEPLGFEKGRKWSLPAINRFKELVVYQTLLAKVIYRCAKVIHVTLRMTTKDNHESISDILVTEGFAQNLSINASRGKESKYVPG